MLEVRPFFERTVLVEPDEIMGDVIQEGLIATVERNQGNGMLVLCLHNFYYGGGKPVLMSSVEILISEWNNVVQICNELVEGAEMVVDIEERKTTITISWKLKKKLQEFGRMGETYEDVIWRLVKDHETLRTKFHNELGRIDNIHKELKDLKEKVLTLEGDLQIALEFIYSKGLGEEYAKFLIKKGKVERVLNMVQPKGVEHGKEEGS